jgi:polyisoprenyl-teichoic acid--peptidoglycan teichoic acid transferase
MMAIYSNTKSRIILSKFKRKILSHVRIIRVAILSLLFVFIVLIGILVYRLVASSSVGTYAGYFRSFAFPDATRLSMSDGRVSILIMGKGGAGHDAPDLTDTMILASISTISKKMTLISIPRDIWVPTLKDKINSAYMYGGLVLAKSIVEETLGEQVDYGVSLDFGGFKDVIDAIGGIQVDVKNGFTDNQYPIAGRENDTCNGDTTYACRYVTVSFTPGFHLMDGDTALEFVRSRHASGPEGSDIARSARQQLVISAIIKKVLTPQTLINISIDKKLISIAQDNIQTDLKPNEEAILARYIVDAKSNMKSYGIPEDLLYNPPNQYKYSGPAFTHAFVFIPARKDGTWTDVQKWVQTVLH